MNKVCIVTGGTRGIGLETVKTFLNAGYHVVLYGVARGNRPKGAGRPFR